MKPFLQRDDKEAEGLPTWYDAMRELASVHLCSRLGFPKLLDDEGFAEGVGVADVCRQPGVGVVQLLLPQVIAMCVVKGLIDLATGVVSVSACEPCCSGRGVLEEAWCTTESDSGPNKVPELTWASRGSTDTIASVALGSYVAGLHVYFPLWPHSKKSRDQDEEVTGSACSMSGAMQVSIYTPHPVVRPDVGSDEVD